MSLHLLSGVFFRFSGLVWRLASPLRPLYIRIYENTFDARPGGSAPLAGRSPQPVRGGLVCERHDPDLRAVSIPAHGGAYREPRGYPPRRAARQPIGRHRRARRGIDTGRAAPRRQRRPSRVSAASAQRAAHRALGGRWHAGGAQGCRRGRGHCGGVFQHRRARGRGAFRCRSMGRAPGFRRGAAVLSRGARRSLRRRGVRVAALGRGRAAHSTHRARVELLRRRGPLDLPERAAPALGRMGPAPVVAGARRPRGVHIRPVAGY